MPTSSIGSTTNTTTPNASMLCSRYLRTVPIKKFKILVNLNKNDEHTQ